MKEEIKFNKELGKKVKELRITSGWSREQLARKISVSQQQLAKYESGGNRISAFRLLQFAKIFGQDVTYFYDKEEVYMPRDKNLACIEFARLFNRLENPDMKQATLEFIRRLVG